MKGYLFGIALIILGVAGIFICPALGLTLDATKYVCLGVIAIGGVIELVSMIHVNNKAQRELQRKFDDRHRPFGI